MDPKEMIEMLKVRNAEAISDLYDQYAPALYGIILRAVKSKSSAEAILEQTFLKVIEEIHLYRSGTTFFTWMCSIARTLAKEPQAEPVLPKQADELSFNPFMREQFTEDYKALTGNMDGECKEVLHQIYFQGRSLQQTSLLLDIPLEKVKVHFRSACDYLRKNFQLEGQMPFTALFILLIHA